MPSVPVCIFLDGPDEYNQLVSEWGEDLAKCANDMLIHICYLNQPENQNIFKEAGQVNTEATIYVRRLLVPYLNTIIDPVTQLQTPPLVPFVDDALIPSWLMEFEVLLGIPESYAQSLRLRSCAVKTATSYKHFRDSFWI